MAYLAGDVNYANAQSSLATLSILPATPTMTMMDTTFTYDGTPKEAALFDLSGVSGGSEITGTVSYHYYFDQAGAQSLPGAPINAGRTMCRHPSQQAEIMPLP